MTNCLLCDSARAERELRVVEVWADPLWRLLTRVADSPVIAFSYLIPRRHIPYITDLDGPEAATLGPILARCTSALREATGTTFVFANIFGERVAHLHVNLAPHSPGDALQGGRRMVAEDAPLIGAAELREAADRLSLLLA